MLSQKATGCQSKLLLAANQGRGTVRRLRSSLCLHGRVHRARKNQRALSSRVLTAQLRRSTQMAQLGRWHRFMGS